MITSERQENCVSPFRELRQNVQSAHLFRKVSGNSKVGAKTCALCVLRFLSLFLKYKKENVGGVDKAGVHN